MTEAPGAYPLTWPASDIKMTDARDRLQRELDLMGARSPILSTNVELRLGGLPRAGPAEPAAAVNFRLKGRPIVLACNRYSKVASNIAAIAAYLDGMRAGSAGVLARQSSSSLLTRRCQRRSYRMTGVPSLVCPRVRPRRPIYRERIRSAHPDTGGSQGAAATLNAACAEAWRTLRP